MPSPFNDGIKSQDVDLHSDQSQTQRQLIKPIVPYTSQQISDANLVDEEENFTENMRE